MIVNYTQITTDKLSTKIVDEVVYIKYDEDTYRVDFGNYGNGVMVGLPNSYIFKAERIDGVLTIVLGNPCNKDGVDLPFEGFNTDNFTDLLLEWKSQDDIDLEEFEQALIPPIYEIEKAERELETIDLLIELEVI